MPEAEQSRPENSPIPAPDAQGGPAPQATGRPRRFMVRGLRGKLVAGALVLSAAGCLALAARDVFWKAPAGQTPGSSTSIGERQHRPFNVLLISLDTTRKDHLSCYGYRRPTTPNIDALSRDSLLFRRCVAVSNWTLPTHASMLTGLYPTTHGAHFVTADVPHIDPDVHPGNLGGLMAEECETLAEILGDRGYRTGAIVANSIYLNSRYQLDQGFAYYDDRPVRPYRRAEPIADEALAWLAQERDRPFFLFLNFMDPHVPYDPPAPHDARFRKNPAGQVSDRFRSTPFWQTVRQHILTHAEPLLPDMRSAFLDLYDGEIAYMDEHVGRILGWLRDHDEYTRTLVIVTADHGETFGEHFLMGHAVGLYEPEIAVPMIVKLPGQQRTGPLDYGVQHVDVLPTVLDLLDLPVPDAVQGASMLSPTNRALFGEQYVYPDAAQLAPRFDRRKWAVYRGNLKYIAYSDGEHELYDLQRDPEERDNLAGEREADVDLSRRTLEQWVERIKPLNPAQGGPAEARPKDLERLRELGYVQ